MAAYDPFSENVTPEGLAGMSPAEQRIRIQVRRLAGFYSHALTYVLVISGLWLLCWFTLKPEHVGELRRWWAIWPTLGWGIGLAVHGLSTAAVFGGWGADWEERKVRELMDREGKRP